MSDEMCIDLMSQNGKQFLFSEYSVLGNADFDVFSHDDGYSGEIGITEDDIHTIDFLLCEIFLYGLFYSR